MKKDSKNLTRRQFVGEASCAAVAGSAALGSLLNIGLLGKLAADEAPAGSDFRALVCVFLAGGNDSFNMLVPNGVGEFKEYANSRGNLAISRDELLPIASPGIIGKEFALHSSLPKVRNFYNAGNAALVANVGTLVDKVNKEKFDRSSSRFPDGLFSHSDQQRQWHTSLPDRSTGSGWLGRLSDLVQDLNGADNFASAISVNGANLIQTAAGTLPYVIETYGSKGLSQWNSSDWAHGRTAVTSQLDLEYENLVQKTFIRRKKSAIELNEVFREALDATPPDELEIGGGRLGQQLQMVLRTIRARELLGVRRQTFFVMLGGWDLHTSLLLPHQALLSQLDEALAGFQTALGDAGLSDEVTTFTASDFGRSLTSNGQGSDHGWGGHQLVMGGAVNGGDIYGEYPDLYEDSPLDLGRGRIIPTTSVDEYFAELACWFGVSRQQLPLVLPYLDRFYDRLSPEPPLGFMNL